MKKEMNVEVSMVMDWVNGGVDKNELMYEFEEEVWGKVKEARKVVKRSAYKDLKKEMEVVGPYKAVKKMLEEYTDRKNGRIYVDYADFFFEDRMDLLVESSVADPYYASLFTDMEIRICRKICGMDRSCRRGHHFGQAAVEEAIAA